MIYKYIKVPDIGKRIIIDNKGTLIVPKNPIIPYIEGDGVGIEITSVMKKVVDAAVLKAYGKVRKIHWMEIYAGEKSLKIYGEGNFLPDETLNAIKKYIVAIKGPLMTPVGNGIRSLNVELRKKLDLYVCLRPIRYFDGVPSLIKYPEKIDITIFRENSEDVYSGIEWKANSKNAKKLINFLINEMEVNSIRFPENSGIGIKLISRQGTVRLVRKAIQYAIDHNKPSVTIVHKGNIMKFTEGSFCFWAYLLAEEEFGAKKINGGPWMKFNNPNTGKKIIIKDCIADSFFQQMLLRPEEHSVIATLNLNGDYISDALAAQVGGIGISPGSNFSDFIALFEATHGTAPKYANKNCVNPCSLILSAAMLLTYIKWEESSELIVKSVQKAILSKQVTYDFARLIEGSKVVSCSDFGEVLIKNIF